MHNESPAPAPVPPAVRDGNGVAEPADAALLRDIAIAAEDDTAAREPDGVMRVIAISLTTAARLRVLAVEMDHRPHERWVRVADELVAELSAEWSEPVRVKITNDDGRELQLVFKRELP